MSPGLGRVRSAVRGSARRSICRRSWGRARVVVDVDVDVREEESGYLLQVEGSSVQEVAADVTIGFAGVSNGRNLKLEVLLGFEIEAHRMSRKITS